MFVRCYGYDFLHAGASARVVNVAANAAALSYFAGGSGFVRQAFIVIVSLLILRTAWTAIRG